MRTSSTPPLQRGQEYLVGPLEPIICREVNDNPRIPGPIQDGGDGAVESAADETAGIQIPLVL